MGKGWAKGLSKKTDARVARMAEAHRGKVYVLRTPFEECKWPIAGKTTLPLEWSDEMAYVVGLTATDGCLFSGRRKLNFTSCDRELVATYLRLLGRSNRVKEAPTRNGGIVYFAEFHDSRLYEWFRSVGLTPRKSLTLGGISVPDRFLVPLTRGLLDGDGSIINEVYRADTGRRSDRSDSTCVLPAALREARVTRPASPFLSVTRCTLPRAKARDMGSLSRSSPC